MLHVIHIFAQRLDGQYGEVRGSREEEVDKAVAEDDRSHRGSCVSVIA